MTNDTPLVSILMTAYNRERLIRESIDSVLASSFKDFELIIVDDCSSDRTVEIAKSYLTTDTRVRVFENEVNLGDYPNRNRAASYATGKYIKYVDSDDILLKEGLAYCVRCMEDFADAEWGILYPYSIPSKQRLMPKEAIEWHFLGDPFLKCGPGETIIKRSFFNSIGMFPVLYGPANDMYFNLNAAASGNVVLLEGCFLYYRRHDGQEQNNQYNYLYNYNKYLKDAIKHLNLPLSEKQRRWIELKRKRRFSVNIVKYFFKTLNFKKTQEAIQKADFCFYDFLEGIFHSVSKPSASSSNLEKVDSI